MNDDEKIIENLKDAGCGNDFIEEFLKIPKDNQHTQLFMLLKFRENILDNYHKDIKKLDCLDYLIYNIKKTQ